MKNINYYFKEVDITQENISLIKIKDKYMKYDYKEIVENFIMEYELYKEAYSEYKLTKKITNWFLNQKDVYLPNELQKFHEFSIETEVAFFHSNNLDLFLIGEDNVKYK